MEKIKQKLAMSHLALVKKSIILVSLMIILASHAASAASNEVISIDSITMDTDSTDIVHVTIAGAADIAGILFDVNYDPAVVEVVDVSANDDVAGLSLTSNIDNDAGKVSIALTSTDPINNVNSISLVDIQLHAIGSADSESPLSLQSVEMSDNTFVIITPQAITNGHIKLNKEQFTLSESKTSVSNSTTNTDVLQEVLSKDKKDGMGDIDNESSSSSARNNLDGGIANESPLTDDSYPEAAGFGGFITIIFLLTLFIALRISKSNI